MQYVTIPLDFEKLPGEAKASIVPICIERADRDGQEIAWGWFEAVENVQEPLRRIARSWLEDVWRVSELAESSVHTLWYKHRFDLGRRPESRILVQAKWHARDLQAGTWRQRRGVEVGLEGLDELYRSRVLTDPAHYADIYERDMYFKHLAKSSRTRGRLKSAKC